MPKKGDNFMETEEVLGKLRQAFAIDATIDEACFYAGINSDTYYRWKKTNPSKYAELEKLRNTPILAARQTLATAVKTNHDLALKYLERKRSKEFAVQRKVELGNDPDNPLFPGVDNLTEAELRERLRELTSEGN